MKTTIKNHYMKLSKADLIVCLVKAKKAFEWCKKQNFDTKFVNELEKEIKFIQEQTKQVAATILKQLGGNKFISMTGAKNFIYGKLDDKNPGIMFQIGSNPANVNKVIITLTPYDTYKMRFVQIKGSKVETIKQFDKVYWDQLQKLFTDVTKLDTHL